MKALIALWLSMLLVVLTLTSAIAGQKIFAIGSWTLSAQWLLLPGVPLLTAVLTWLYGKSYARKIVWINSSSYLLAIAAINLAVAVPADHSWHLQVLYSSVLTFHFFPIFSMAVCMTMGQLLIIQFTPTQSQEIPCLLKGWLPLISLLFMISLLVANITTQKITHLLHITVDVGTLLFPITYIFNNLFTEVYGYKRSRIIIWGALLGNLVMVILLQGMVWLPPAISWHNQAAYQTIIGTVPRIVLASTLAFFAGEFCNSFCLAKLKILTSGRYLWIRTIGSTMVGVAIDSLVFSGVAFLGALPFLVVLTIALWEYILKVGYEILATPLTVMLIRWIKHHEHQDQFDYTTRFNPLYVKDMDYL